jgi:SAM-dependent methyltransferase
MPALYDQIGNDYAATRRADPAIVRRLHEWLDIGAGDRVLDLGCGSGNYTQALALRGGRWVGLDPSAAMLRQAMARRSAIDWVLGEAGAMPFGERRFERVLCTLAIHHFERLDLACAEVRRVLVPGGSLVFFTAFAEQMQHYWLVEYFPTMMARSIAQMPTRAATLQALHGAGFTSIRTLPYEVDAGLRDLFLYAGKQRPALYLDAAVRANISSFARLCPADELQRGLQRLQADLQQGRMEGVRARHAAAAAGQGDYAFVAAGTPIG